MNFLLGIHKILYKNIKNKTKKKKCLQKQNVFLIGKWLSKIHVFPQKTHLKIKIFLQKKFSKSKK